MPGLGDGPADLDAVVLAAAGLTRLGRLDAVTELLPVARMTPAPGQGALAVECRSGELAAALAPLDHAPTRLAVAAERALLATLEAGCAAPVGALGRVADGRLVLEAVVVRPDGTARLAASAEVVLGNGSDDDAARSLGRTLAGRLLADGAADLAPLGPGPQVGEP